MELLQPILLWGAAAAIIPILIHLWYSRKGKPLPWATLRFLTQQKQQPQKGFRPDNILLLILRIFILLLTVFILAKPFLPDFKKQEELLPVHLVQPQPGLVNEFRFELEQAMESGHELYWMAEGFPEVENLEQANDWDAQSEFLPEFLKEKLAEDQEFHLYLLPTEQLLDQPVLVTPSLPEIHIGDQEALPTSQRFIAVNEEEFLAVGEEGELLIINTPQEGDLVHEGPLTYQIHLEDSSEIRNIEISLRAIQEVYGLEIEPWDENMNEPATLIFADTLPQTVQENQVAFISNRFGATRHNNLHFVPAPFKRDDNDLVSTGRLPEFILEKWLELKNMSREEVRVTKGQLENVFHLQTKSLESNDSNIQEWLLLLLCLFIIAERAIALKKGI